MQRITELKGHIEDIAKQQMELRFLPVNERKSSYPSQIRMLRKRMMMLKIELQKIRGAM